MSAIQRDREIAAKATQGVWLTGWVAKQGRPETMRYAWSRLESRKIADCSIENQPKGVEDTAHIVRLHNRQPLYDALVDAAPSVEKLRALADWLDLKYPNDPHPEVQRDLRALADALATLDQEEP